MQTAELNLHMGGIHGILAQHDDVINHEYGRALGQ
jgi:hypothetical protein